MGRATKALSCVLYLPRRKERAVQITRRNKYSILRLQNLELLLVDNMVSREKHGWSVLQSSFTAPKFDASVGDTLRVDAPPSNKNVATDILVC
jgi:hypothetical protein